MSLVLAALLALAPAPTRADAPRAKVVVAPLAVTGRLDAAWQIEFEQRLRAGLRRGAVDLVEPDRPGKCRNDDACWAKLARASAAAFVVEARVTVEDRDYDVHVQVRSADAGTVRARVDQRCELCGLGEAAARVSDAAAAIAEELDVLTGARSAIAVETTPGGAAIEIDGQRVGSAPVVHEVAPGEHSITARLPGYRPEQRRIDAAAGVQQLVRIDLVSSRTPGRDRVRIAGFAVLGIGLAAVVSGSPLIAIDERPVTSRCSGQNVNPFGVCKYRHATLEGGAVLVATGVAAVIAGTVMAIVGRRQPRRTSWRPGGLVVRF